MTVRAVPKLFLPSIESYSKLYFALHGVDTFSLVVDLLNPLPASQKTVHKKKRLVQGPNSYFMDVKCQGCFNITTVFSHAQTAVACPVCNQVLCHPTGGKARLVDGTQFRRKFN